MNKTKIISGLMGLCVGDALGVPVEFLTRETIARNPVLDMMGYGTYDQPPGTWSDDSSLAFCLAESLCNGYDIHDAGKKFCQWRYEGYWTPHGRVFDIGSTTRKAISNLHYGESPYESGVSHKHSNGNGSLMRILPLVFYLENTDDRETQFRIIKEVSAITHAHPVSIICCGFYVFMGINLLKGMSLE